MELQERPQFLADLIVGDAGPREVGLAFLGAEVRARLKVLAQQTVAMRSQA
jgi:hypothetical protein